VDRWFEVDGAEGAFLVQLRARARDWPAIATTRPDDTGGWWQDGLLITYADRSNTQHTAIVESFRVDFDGTRALAARVASEHVQEGSFFRLERPEGDDPVEIASGSPPECADAAADWFRCRLAA
jgi:hypothetical protein